MRFLKYIRQWGKKVVFLVNKVDILSDSGEARHSPMPLGLLLHKCLPSESASLPYWPH